MTATHDKLAAALLAPSIQKLKERERQASPEERHRNIIISAVMNAGCSHQNCISLADAEHIADAVIAL